MQKTKDSAGSISDEGYAERLSKQCRCEDDGQAKTFIIPLNEVFKTESFCCFSYGEQSKAYQHHKVIMLVGATGVGKSTLINTMINYILGVKWEDDFRFKIVDKRVEGPQSQAHSQTQVIGAYTIHSNEHHAIPYTLTIIDTPGFGDTRGIERDKAIVHQVKEFFSHPEDHHVDHLDALGFVTNSSKIRFDYTQKYIFHSILSLYGKDIEPNIVILATFSDKEPLQVVSAFKEENIRCEGNLFKFNNSALFECNVAEGGSDSDEDDLLVNRSHWNKGMKNMHFFFQYLEQLKRACLCYTKQILHERLRLENISEHLYQQIQTINTKIGQIKIEKKMPESHEPEMMQNIRFLITCYAEPFQWVETELGAMNCTKCKYTCHFPCSLMKNSNYLCRVFDIKGRCTVCPRKCKTRDHIVLSVRKKPRLVKKMTTSKNINGRQEKAAGRGLPVQQVIQELNTDIQDHMQCLQSLNSEAASCMQRLQEIALKPQISVKEYVDMLIEQEKNGPVSSSGRVMELEQMKSREEALARAWKMYRKTPYCFIN